MGSFNHSYLQSKLSAIFMQMDGVIALTELSLDTSSIKAQFPHVSDTLVPDISIYPTREINLERDVYKMTEMPLLIIEILSPRQSVQQLVDKMEFYFSLGIQSGWLVYPASKTISVYKAPFNSQSFSGELLVDKVLNLELQLSMVFG